jgi:hypothetical protein
MAVTVFATSREVRNRIPVISHHREPVIREPLFEIHFLIESREPQ